MSSSAGDSSQRKRKSRFSDAPTESDRPNKIAATSADSNAERRALDPAALAKLAAAKIARSIPTSVAASGAPGSAVAATVPSLSSSRQVDLVSAAEQRKRADLIYKSVQEQMTHIKALLQKPGAASQSSTSATGFMPAPLLLDEQGRQVDENGNVIESSTPSIPGTKRPTRQAKSTQNPYLVHRAVEKEDKLDAVDPRLKTKKREVRAAKCFSFVKQGTYIKQGEQLRAKEAKRMLSGFTSGRNPRGYKKEAIVAMDELPEPGDDDGTEKAEMMELLDVEVPVKPESTTPDVEWWDLDYLPKEKRDAMDKFGFIKAQARKERADITVSYTGMKAKYCGTLHVIEHPARVKPIVKQDTTPVAIPLMLTAAERKKIRRQNRAEREKEKQDKIALGLMPPPEPKVKLSNMMKVLGEQAVADPSAVERKVRQQMAQREKNHEMRNLARKLTPEERREKKLKKIKEDASGDIHAAVFRVSDLSNPQHRFKVDMNAQQFHLTGGVLCCKQNNVTMVVVEGGRKAIKHYTRLMTKRIRWREQADGDSDEDEDDADSTDGADDTGKDSGCALVWQGIVAKRAFNNFRFQECSTSVTARKVMEAKHVVHYWDLVEKSAEGAR
ncbi:hypothetical protein PINS_up000016 [Pythium insidiosum]|nr:hypothetical protein PINS_up000016 [Pythium insidiosum]